MSYTKTYCLFICALFLLLFGAAPVMAVEEAADFPEIRAAFSVLLKDKEPDHIAPTPIAGLYEVTLGMSVAYVTENGRYLIQGNIIDLEQKLNITEPRINELRAVAIEQVSEDNMVIFGGKELEYTVTVFTDIDCGFCRKLHSEIDGYNQAGIRVRYLFFPRAGIDSPSYHKAVSVWCAEDRNQAMTTAKKGEPLEEKDCDNPVKEHMLLGEMMGVTGTPALVLKDGKILPGYLSPDQLLKYLEK